MILLQFREIVLKNTIQTQWLDQWNCRNIHSYAYPDSFVAKPE